MNPLTKALVWIMVMAFSIGFWLLIGTILIIEFGTNPGSTQPRLTDY